MTTTNLSRRPFRNERLPWLLALLLLLGTLVLSLVHGRFLGRLLSGEEARTVRLVREDEARIAELEEGLAKEPPLKVDTAELARLRAFKELVDRRVFPWGRLLSELEVTLGDNTRLNKISPTAAKAPRGMLVELAGVARTKDDAFTFAESLDASRAFSNASLKSLTEQGDGVEFTMEVLFDPQPAQSAGLPPSPPALSSPAASSDRKTMP